MNSNENAEIDLLEVFYSIRKHWLLIIILAVLLGGGAYAYARFAMTPMYEASVNLIVNSKSDQSTTLTGDNINSATKLVEVYSIIIKSNTVLDEVIENLNLDMRYTELYDNLTVSSVNSTQVMKLVVKNSDVEVAAKIAAELARVVPDTIVEAVEAGSCKPVSKVEMKTNPISPNKTKYALLGAFLGVVIGVVIAIIKMLTHNTIVTDEDIKKYLELPVLGIIPEISEDFHG